VTWDHPETGSWIHTYLLMKRTSVVAPASGDVDPQRESAFAAWEWWIAIDDLLPAVVKSGCFGGLITLFLFTGLP
jgi:hypothetical protein